MGGTVLRGALGSRQLAPTFRTTLAGVAVVAGAHIVGGACDGGINGMRRSCGVRELLWKLLGELLRMLGQRLHIGLACAGSEEMLS